MTTDYETMEQYLNFVRTRFLIYVLVFVSHDYEVRTLEGSRPPVPYGANFLYLSYSSQRQCVYQRLCMSLCWSDDKNQNG